MEVISGTFEKIGDPSRVGTPVYADGVLVGRITKETWGTDAEGMVIVEYEVKHE